MATVTYRRKDQTVTLAANRHGTRRILERAGFVLQMPEVAFAALDLPANVTAALEARYASPADVADAPDDELLAIDGIGPATLRAIRERL